MSQSGSPCRACGEGGYRQGIVPRSNLLVRGLARGVGLVAVAGAIYGVFVASSGFHGHYGGYPRGQLIVHSLLVGMVILAASIGVGLCCGYLLGKKRLLCCDRCGHLPEA